MVTPQQLCLGRIYMCCRWGYLHILQWLRKWFHLGWGHLCVCGRWRAFIDITVAIANSCPCNKETCGYLIFKCIKRSFNGYVSMVFLGKTDDCKIGRMGTLMLITQAACVFWNVAFQSKLGQTYILSLNLWWLFGRETKTILLQIQEPPFPLFHV